VAYKDTPEKIEAYLKAGGNPYAELIYDPKGAIGITLGITGVPESFAVDDAGLIRARIQGPLTTEDDLKNVVGWMK
jgi:cytochrome c biogenesis protein CcmG, thiol:disulfide interchange protein DsbE